VLNILHRRSLQYGKRHIKHLSRSSPHSLSLSGRTGTYDQPYHLGRKYYKSGSDDEP
jgi:hypothetical protein